MPDEEQEEKSGPNVLEQAEKIQKAVKFLGTLVPMLQPILIVLGIILLIIVFIVIVGFALSYITDLGGIQSTDPIQGFANTGGGGSGTGQLTAPQNLDPVTAGKCLDKYVKSIQSDSALIGTGKNFVAAGNNYNVNPAFLLAMSLHESTRGTSLLIRTENNTAGLSSKSSTFKLRSNGRITSNVPRPAAEGSYYITFVDLEEGIAEQAWWISNWYIGKGDDTILKIGTAWVGRTLAEGQTWADSVSGYYSGIQGMCPEFSSSIGGGAGGSVLDIARNEIGTCEYPPESNCIPDKPYEAILNDDKRGPWCAAFATWVYRTAGYKSTPKEYLTTNLYAFFRSNPNFYGFEAEDDTPQPGDLVFIARSPFVYNYGPGVPGIGHVAIVETVSGNKVNTIDGNVGSGNQCVARRSYVVQKNGGVDKAVSFGRPK